MRKLLTFDPRPTLRTNITRISFFLRESHLHQHALPARRFYRRPREFLKLIRNVDGIKRHKILSISSLGELLPNIHFCGQRHDRATYSFIRNCKYLIKYIFVQKDSPVSIVANGLVTSIVFSDPTTKIISRFECSPTALSIDFDAAMPFTIEHCPPVLNPFTSMSFSAFRSRASEPPRGTASES